MSAGYAIDFEDTYALLLKKLVIGIFSIALSYLLTRVKYCSWIVDLERLAGDTTNGIIASKAPHRIAAYI